MQKAIVTVLLLLCLATGGIILYAKASRSEAPPSVASAGSADGRPVPPVLEPGSTAPDFTLTSTAGQPIRMAELLKKGPLLLCFYKLECQTSAMAVPKFETFYKAYAGKENFSIIGIVQNPATQVAASLSERGLTFPHAEDPGYDVSRRYAIRSTPTLVLVGADGRVIARAGGWDREKTNQISETVAKTLGAQYEAISTASDGLPAFRPG